MKNSDYQKSTLLQTLEICDLHQKRMKFAIEQLRDIFPLDEKSYNELTEHDISIIDQMIYRFSKLQDTMGSRLFIQTLGILEEDYSDKPFIDILIRLEKLGLIQDYQEWIKMREIRNQLAHEYPSEVKEIIDSLNLLFSSTEKISKIYADLKSYLDQRLQK